MNLDTIFVDTIQVLFKSWVIDITANCIEGTIH